MQTTLTAEGTATRGLVKCFWASKNPSAELCKQNKKCQIKWSSLKHLQLIWTEHYLIV